MSGAGDAEFRPPTDWPERFNLAEYFVDANLDAGRGAKRALLVDDDARTYDELATRSRRLAAVLRQLGVRPEERVLICLPDGFEFAEVFFGALRAGAVFAMVNPLLGADAYRYYLDYTKCRVAVVHADALPALEEAFEASRHCRHLVVVGGEAGKHVDYEAALATEDPGSALAETEPTGPDDLAGWLFTSGSTGRPKACVHRQSDFAYSTETYAKLVVGYGEDEVALGVPKLFFGYATGTNLMFPLRFGGVAALFPGRSTADELFDRVALHRPTLLTSVPTMIGNMLRSPRMESTDLSSLRVVLSAGEALPKSLYDEWVARTGVEILDGIGSAEMFHIYASNRFGAVRPGTLGTEVPGYEIDLVDVDGKRVPDGEPGRLRVKGGSTAICYWADREQSDETFHGPWCTSADVFRRNPDGTLVYEGRTDDLIKVSGIWVSPLEIEDALLAHDAVAECCVVAREDDAGLVKPLAFVVPAGGREGGEALASELKAHVKARLAPHKYPRWFEWRDALPKNDRGKVARKDLRAELEAAQAPSAQEPA